MQLLRMHAETTAATEILNGQSERANPIILVVEDVHETSDGIEKLLKADGYRISSR